MRAVILKDQDGNNLSVTLERRPPRFTANVVETAKDGRHVDVEWLEDVPPTPEEVLADERVQALIRQTCSCLD